ncbi:MAG: molybdopterin-dependent oxidoreductase, partial [Candidatus Cloacimonetes bacterium]|nr:molybdopterin-dependent oxidoreductase [Candidatus Cloacimonadota bacterium]
MNYRYIGKSITRIDGKEKVSGAAIYGDDIDFGPNLLYAEIVSSTQAHAIIKSIDTKAAEKVEGVVKVFTGKDFPYKFGLYMKDRYIFAQDKVRFVGEQVAAVIARTPQAAKRGAQLVKVEYKPLPAVTNQMDALKKDSVLLHPELGEYPHVPWFFPKAGTNIAHWRKTRKGDLEKGFKVADLVYEDEYFVPRYAHCAIETHVAIGKYDLSGRLTVWSSSQSPHTQRHLFAEALAPMGLTHKDIRVIAPHVGGGFGGKAGVTMEILPAALATKLQGYAVKLRWTREQEFVNTYQRLGVVARIKMGVKKDGTISALDHKIYWDAGAYVEYGANVVNAVGLSAIGPYRIPNVSIDSVCVYTNLPPGGAYRGFGYSEMLFGLESHVTQIAKKLGMDEVKFRLKNAIREGDTTAYGAAMNPSGLQQCIEKVAKEIDWGKKVKSKDPKKVIGKGFSIFWKAPAMPPNASSSAFLKFNEDASINLIISGMDIGQGYQTVMAQIAAEILSVPPSKIRVETPDTDRNPYEWQTVASHITWGSGNAVKRAALDAR